jgi:hypothetical protein
MDNGLQNAHFLEVLALKVCPMEENSSTIFMETQADKLFFPNLYKIYNLYVLMDFRPDSRSVNHPTTINRTLSHGRPKSHARKFLSSATRVLFHPATWQLGSGRWTATPEDLLFTGLVRSTIGPHRRCWNQTNCSDSGAVLTPVAPFHR